MNNCTRKVIIGLTGFDGSGKGKIAGYLSKKGFVKFSLSDELREEARKLGIEPIKENLIKLGNELREKHGANHLAVRVINRMKNTGSNLFVIDSIRNPEEANELKKLSGFKLVFVDAPVDVRFSRILTRNNSGDVNTKNIKSVDDLQKFDAIQAKSEKTTDLNIDKCVQMADHTIANNSSDEVLYEQIDKIISIPISKII